VKRSPSILLVFSAVFLALVLTSGVSPIGAEVGAAAGAGGAASGGGATPDVYVAANNSFVITVPNLSKVAVGNPAAVLANVISTTEVLVQGSASVTNRGDGLVNFATSNVYVWSGEKRYVYRVIVVETSDTSLPYGVTRMVVEPNKVLVYGRTADLTRTDREVRGMFEALNVKYELHMTEVSLTEAVQEYVNVDRARVEEAVSRGEILVGMTLDDVQRSQGGTMPPIYHTIVTDTRIIDLYQLPNYRLGVTSGVVASVEPRTRLPEALSREAIQHGIVMEDMTESEMLRALGQPGTPPTVREEAGRLLTEYSFPNLRVRTSDGRVVGMTSQIPIRTAPDVAGSPLELGEYVYRDALGRPIRAFTGRMYRLQYISGDEFKSRLDEYEEEARVDLNYYFGYGTDGLVGIIADATAADIVGGLVTMFDRPIPRRPYELTMLNYRRQAYDPIRRATVDVECNFTSARFSKDVSLERRYEVYEELQEISDLVPGRLVATQVTLKNDIIAISGESGPVSVVRTNLRDLVPAIIGKDYADAVRAGKLLPGMTRAQVEQVVGVKLEGSSQPYQLPDGHLGWNHDLGNRVVIMSEDILVEAISYPGPDDVRNALQKRRLVPYMLRADVERILNETARQTTKLDDGREAVDYNFGKAVYWTNRLISMNGVAGSEMQRLGISVQVPDEDNFEFQQLTPEEQQLVMQRGTVMRGMTERDVARVVGQAPFAIKPGAMPNEKLYTYADYEVVFRDGIAWKVSSIGAGNPRIIALKSRRASEILSLISSTFPDSYQHTVTADSVSNRLIVRAADVRFLEIERFAKAMDQQEIPQVLIEAKFVEINRDAVKNLGVQWGLSAQSDAGNQPFAGFGGSNSRTDPNTQPSAGVRSGNGANFPLAGSTDAGILLGMFGGSGFSLGGLRYTNVDVMIAALESSGDAEVLSSPRIVTLNNQPAELRSIETVYDVTTTQTIDALTGLTTFATRTTPKDVGIELNCNPTIGQDGIISLSLDARVSRVARVQNYGVGTNVIIINETTERTSQSRVMVRSGTPLVIGGLSSRDSRRNTQKVPFLGDLPFIGHIFRSERNDATDVDLLIFLTARIVPPDGTISSVDRALAQPRAMIPNPSPTTTLPAGAAAPGAATSTAAN
jgi:Flp pilus assembly secretin CpaC